jgi:hypothetical protein
VFHLCFGAILSRFCGQHNKLLKLASVAFIHAEASFFPASLTYS